MSIFKDKDEILKGIEMKLESFADSDGKEADKNLNIYENDTVDSGRPRVPRVVRLAKNHQEEDFSNVATNPFKQESKKRPKQRYTRG